MNKYIELYYSVLWLFIPSLYLKTKRGRKELRLWSVAVRKRDKRCKVCGSYSFKEAHHINPKSKVPRLALHIKNGITLCKYCHRLNRDAYHKTYGIGNKTTFKKWYKKHKKR